ncbi:polysaccharide biosynthesis tyrosine autokinase [Photobacterium angustum]|uniref:polysaccharide biosynthesis tyrosine autokinase n=1 Tax=Photobacterium angustum TaxID=661 RepID=UPI0005E1D200|nr:polysaccharide biosynthesis tyrosine autokinase [Photobacterium angustum]KJG18222.1 tyrosine protein kinase [Photobacterium angustum]KJG26314.1 tyrosine protein kinase [Photobacterium angustum]KJG32324.1 tyrosine protein kinase [Photobacterium angustum]PSW93466.1 tyrosine-protein kinase [Photobacterium angustum]PSX02436.1 tyrosine-protein kinase [Photobacterium angustum]
MSLAQNLTNKATPNNSDEIDLGKLFGILVDNRWNIIVFTLFFTFIGIAYALLATPIYKADALIQVEQKSTGMPALGGDMADLLSSESTATTEIEIIKSRMVLGETVDKLNLTIVAIPNYMPVIGKGLARLTGDSESVSVSRFLLPDSALQNGYVLTVTNSKDGEYTLANKDGRDVLKGQVGKLAENKGISLLVTDLNAKNDATFTLSKISRLDAIQGLQRDLSVSERGKQTGILQLSMTGENRTKIKEILNDISQNYFLQNVERNSAEAEKSLVFLKKHLPEIKAQLNNAEDKLNHYRQLNESVDLNLEAKTALEVMVNVESQLNELTFKESDISQRFTKEHPAYIALLDKRKTLLSEKARLNKRVEKLPKTQQEILRLTRNVEVNQQIYVELLNKVQELSIVKASTVGNVRILDSAQSYSQAVKPKKALIVVLATLLGGMLSVAIALLRAAFHKGVETPDQIEEIGLPVYASIPLSDSQTELLKKQKGKNLTVEQTLLSVYNPADLSVEALRSLRTSLHFAMMEAKNNVLMVSGPSPGIGKSFVSVNLASVIAKAGQKVLIIDADMRKGRMETQLCTDNKPGLSDYLCGKQDFGNIVRETGVNGLEFIPRGDTPPNPSELIMHPRFKALIEWAGQHYDMVIVDTPPILAVTDAAIVGAHVGTTLLVGRFEQNTVKEIEVAKQRFEQNGIEVKGFILNAIVRKASSTYGGNYGYYNYSYDSK